MCLKTLFTTLFTTFHFFFREGSILAIVNNIFQNTNITDEAVRNIIDVAINESSSDFFGNVTYESKFVFLYWILSSSAEGFSNLTLTCFVPAKDLCLQKPFPCEASTTSCRNSHGQATCFCLPGYIPFTYSLSSCKGKNHSFSGSVSPLTA